MEENIIGRLKLTPQEVLCVVSQWYQWQYSDILQNEDGHELCEITQTLWEENFIENEEKRQGIAE